MAYLKKPGGYARKSDHIFKERSDYKNGSPVRGFGARGSFTAKRESYGEPAERFQATCNECHKVCEVPFRPNGKKPVYCRDCFKGKEENPSYGARSSHRDSAPQNPDFAKRLDAIDAKLDRILKSLGK